MKRFTLPCAFVLALLPGLATLAAPAPYEPRPVELAKDAGYVLADGSVYVVGNDGMEEMLEQLNGLFAKTHPGMRFTMLLKGSSTGIGGLTAGVSAFAPMGREAWPTDLAGFRELYGYEPLAIRVGYDGYGPRPKRKNPPAIYVNAKNPLASLTVEEAARIFTTGTPGGDLTRWNQLGLKGAWAQRAIHPYGPRDDGGLGTAMRVAHMGKRPYTARYEPLEKNADAVRAVADDPYGIALTGFFDAATVPGVKLVPLAAAEGAPAAAPTYENVASGRYPYAPNLYFYLNRAPGKALDPLVKEYLRLVLSKEGQDIIASQKESEEGYVPLNPADVAAELAKLE
jgi:phosphate transport system substrate-binding protein